MTFEKLGLSNDLARVSTGELAIGSTMAVQMSNNFYNLMKPKSASYWVKIQTKNTVFNWESGSG